MARLDRAIQGASVEPFAEGGVQLRPGPMDPPVKPGDDECGERRVRTKLASCGRKLMQRRTYPLASGDMAAVHFGRVSNPLKLVFLHANGFCGQAYASVLEPLGVHAMAVDLRGHGRTTLPANPRDLKSWTTFRDDVVELFERHIPRPVVVAGHSLGAASAILAARKLGPRMSGYVGLDPVILGPLWGAVARMPGYRAYAKRRLPLARNAGNRRAEFASREAAFDHYHGRGAYKRFPDAVLRDYVAGGTLPSGDGVRLACEPAWEQAIFVAQAHDILGNAKFLPRFSRILFAGRGAPQTPGARERIARTLGPDRVARDMDVGHLFPLERPEMATQVLRDALQEVALARR